MQVLTKYFALTTLVVLVFYPLEKAFPIGRVGNNSKIGDTVEGYFATIPAAFPNVMSGSFDRSAQLISSEILATKASDYFSDNFDNSEPTALTMLASPLSVYFPDLIGKNSAAMQDYLKTKFQFNLTVVPNTQCATLLFGENEVGYIGVAQWGDGHGYVITVQKTPSQIGRQGILSILNTTVINHSCKQ
jgi:hypothetical protein